ncbi:unnamed protein product, partial [Ectocarpus sp. 6 AP-2014]
PGGQVLQVVGKTRTSCNFCISRKKGCEYIEIDGKKQQCKLCKEKQQECIFEMKPPRTAKRKEGASAAQRSGGGASGGQRNGGGAAAGTAASRSSTALVAGSSSRRKPPSAVMKRARLGPSAATGLVGFEENVYVSDFFDRLGFFPLANQKTVRRAIMEVLFRPAEEQGSFRGGAESMEGVFSGALAIQKFGSNTQESKAFSCMLWCTIALGAMTNNLKVATVRRYIKLAEEAVDGLCTEDVPTAKAYTIMAMVYAWQDNSAQFAEYLGRAQKLVDSLDASEEIPMELTDIMKELERVRVLHYTEDEDVIHKCCYEADGEPPTMTLAMLSDAGLFHMVRYYTNGVFKAFWRDLHEVNSDLPATTRFAEKHLHECSAIEDIANSREGLKNSAGALYIRAAMQFMRLPLKTDPVEALKSTIVLTKIICQVPGMVRYGPLKHYVHCLVMMLKRPAILGVDKGSYEKLRKLYNSLDIAGPVIEAAEDMDMAMLCKHQFCNGMAWIHQEKMLKMKRAQAAAEAAAAAGTATAVPGLGAGGGLPGGALGPVACVNEEGAATSTPRGNGSSARGLAGGDGSGGSGDAAPAASSSPHLPSPGGGGGNRIDHFPQAAAASAAAAEAGAVGGDDLYSTPPFPQEQSPLPHHAPLSQCRLDDPLVAAPFDGTGASMFPPKQEGTEPFPYARGGSADGGAVAPDMFSPGWTWNDDLQQGSHQQQRSLGRGDLAALHPRGGPSAAAFLAPPLSQQQQQQQQQQQPQWLQQRQQQQQQQQWGGGAPPSSLRNAAGSSVAAGAGAAAPQGMEGTEMPAELYEFAQNKVRQQQQQESSGHRDQFPPLQELLGVDAHDDSRSVPELAAMDSDAEEFTLAPGAGAGGEGNSLHKLLFSPGEE